jgi:hypothetical protein
LVGLIAGILVASFIVLAVKETGIEAKEREGTEVGKVNLTISVLWWIGESPVANKYKNVDVLVDPKNNTWISDVTDFWGEVDFSLEPGVYLARFHFWTGLPARDDYVESWIEVPNMPSGANYKYVYII